MTIVYRAATFCLLVSLGMALSGCIIEPIGPGWCFHHPYRCR